MGDELQNKTTIVHYEENQFGMGEPERWLVQSDVLEDKRGRFFFDITSVVEEAKKEGAREMGEKIKETSKKMDNFIEIDGETYMAVKIPSDSPKPITKELIK